MSDGFKSFDPVDEALDRLTSAVEPLDRTGSIPLSQADDRIVATVIRSPSALPREDQAAMDGYAVRADDTHGASPRAARTLSMADEAGAEQAVRVHTGSPMPDGADAVVMVEEAERDRDRVDVLRSVPEGRHVRTRGEDVDADEVLFEPGHRLRPSDVGLLKAVGVDEVPVVARPRVDVVPTGDEVVEAAPGPGEVVESNGIVVRTSLRRWGAEPVDHGIVPDDPDRLRRALDATSGDAVATIGGTSVGERDLLPDVLDDRGERLFHGVELRPGHPVGAWIVDGRPVLTLPGYPVAALVTATLFLRPVVRKLGRRPDVPDPSVRARLARKVPSKVGDLHVVRVRLEETDDGTVAHPTRAKGAGVISSVTRADGVVFVPSSREGLDEGAEVEVVLWG